MIARAPPALAPYLRYAAASGIALAGDLACFLALLAAHVPAAAASAIGYSLGIAVHWLASSRAVFADAVAPRGPARRRQQALFVATAFAGLGVTVGLVACGQRLGVDPRAAKLGAIGASFQIGWLLRRRLVFA